MNNVKPVLILQLRPEDETSDNEYQAILNYGELTTAETKRLRIEKAGIPADLSIHDYSAIIVGGSPFDISTPAEQKSAIQHQIEADFDTFLTEVIKHDFPFLGACSGNGLLGSHLGTTISKKYGEAVGSVLLTITEQGQQDPLLKGFPNQVYALLGHKEACDELPQGATLLMTGKDCPIQMFRIGQNVYATQFHPEGDSDGFSLRIQVYKHFGYFDPNEADQLIQAVNQIPTPYAQHVLRRFVQRYYHDQATTQAQARIDLLMMDWASAKPLAQVIREKIFIQEQNVPESEEWDDQDETAQHIIAFDNGQAVGTARLSFSGKVGRMAVLPAYRGKGIGSAMLNKLIQYAVKTTQSSLILWSQTHAQGFYQQHGFKAQGKEFLDAGIPHIEMHLTLDQP